MFNTGNICSKIGQIVTDFWQILQHETNSLSFSFTNFVNPKPIEWHLNHVFSNKYGKIGCWLRNYENLQEFKNSLISVFHP